MAKLYFNILQILRQRIPIGMQDGLLLLQNTNGNIEKAEEEFQKRMIDTLITKTGIEKDIALRYLIEYNYNITKIVNRIEEERFTLTELILRKHQNDKQEALQKIIYPTELKYAVKRDFWLNFKDLKDLPKEVYTFLTIMDWLNYEDWEGYMYVLGFNLEIIREQIEVNLGLPDLAISLKQANTIKQDIFQKNEFMVDIQHYVKASNLLEMTEEYNQHEAFFKIQRPILIDRLYEGVIANLNLYP